MDSSTQPHKKRNYRHNDKDDSSSAQASHAFDELASQLGLTPEMLLQVMLLKNEVMEAVGASVDSKMQAFEGSEEFWQKMQARLKDKRMKLEDELIEKISAERSIHLERRRREMDGARRQHTELEKNNEDIANRIDKIKSKIHELNSY
jgi:hypothetical protein